VHAEQNAIIQAALHGVSIEGSTLYCTHQPCILCAKMMINARIRVIVYKESYPDETALDFLDQAGLEVRKLTEKIL
jgi:dCMP deaminase